MRKSANSSPMKPVRSTIHSWTWAKTPPPAAPPTSLVELAKAIEHCLHEGLSPLEVLNHCNKTVLLGNMRCHSALSEESTHAHFTASVCSAWHIPFVMLVMDLSCGSHFPPGPRRSGPPAPRGGSVRIER